MLSACSPHMGATAEAREVANKTSKAAESVVRRSARNATARGFQRRLESRVMSGDRTSLPTPAECTTRLRPGTFPEHGFFAYFILHGHYRPMSDSLVHN